MVPLILIDQLGLPFTANDVIPLPVAQEKKRDRGLGEEDANSPLALLQNKFLRLSDTKEIERHQTVIGFSVSKNRRMECFVRFNFCGNEKERIIEAIDTFRLGISKVKQKKNNPMCPNRKSPKKSCM